MYGIEVNPAQIQVGDSIATRYDRDTLRVIKARKVRRVSICPGKPECIHLDHECYDVRFATVVKA